MKTNFLAIAAALGLALATSSCITQSYSGPRGDNRPHSEMPGAYHGDHADTANKSKPITVDSTDVHVICPRVTGKSQGYKILGFIPVRLASETEAVNNMYQDARNRGVTPEGKACHFINHSVEHKANFRLLYSAPEVRASADLVEILPPGKGMEKLIERDAPRVAAATPAPEPAQKETKAKKTTTRKIASRKKR